MICSFETQVLGIPCIIEVTSWEPYLPPKWGGHPDTWAPEEGGYGDYVILTRKGKPAKLIERKMNDKDRKGLELEIFDRMEFGLRGDSNGSC
jgi:hypothetical protein